MEEQNEVIEKAGSTLAALFIAYVFTYISGLLSMLGVNLSVVQHRAICLGFILVIVFLFRPARKTEGRRTLPWYDVLAISLSILTTGYVAAFQALALEHYSLGFATNYEILFTWCLIAVLLEASRRVLGKGMPLIVFCFAIHPLVSGHLPGIFAAKSYSLERLTGLLYLFVDGIFGSTLHVGVTIIIMFVIFGQFLSNTGGGKFFLDFALYFVGGLTGGPAKAASISSAIFGTLSGSTAANVAVDGVITIPMMKRAGFSPAFSAAVEATVSNGGLIMPPVMGAVAFILAEMISVPYVEVCIASIIPAVLYYLCVTSQIHFYALRHRIGAVPRSEVPPLKQTLLQGWHFSIPALVLVACMFFLHFTAEKSAWWAIVAMVLVTCVRKRTRLKPKEYISVFKDSVLGSSTAILACALAGIIMGSMSVTAFGLKLTGALTYLAGGSLLLLLLLAALSSFILGMGMTSIPCYIMVAITVGPALVDKGIPLLNAHLFVFWWGILSFLTPPVAVAAYIAASIAKSSPMRTGFNAMRLAIVAYILPFLFIYSPGVLLKDSFGNIIRTTVTLCLGVVLLSSGLEGYLRSVEGISQRILFIVAGLLMMSPWWQVEIAGAILGFVCVLWQLKATKPMAKWHPDGKLLLHQENISE